jgi:hypothetical protein
MRLVGSYYLDGFIVLLAVAITILFMLAIPGLVTGETDTAALATKNDDLFAVRFFTAIIGCASFAVTCIGSVRLSSVVSRLIFASNGSADRIEGQKKEDDDPVGAKLRAFVAFDLLAISTFLGLKAAAFLWSVIRPESHYVNYIFALYGAGAVGEILMFMLFIANVLILHSRRFYVKFIHFACCIAAALAFLVNAVAKVEDANLYYGVHYAYLAKQDTLVSCSELRFLT